uniref:PP2C family protein-serine/threonine phosphatase n=1 Tax=Tessaracoccus timonensis TaxID=2161816 RepID=UPI000D550538|nr:protein phosphatase 2C domain-containing protein [Tessaracoccus timonensis]
MYSIRWAAHSEVGRVRKNNQDAAYASPTMLLVCDGMGGAAAGDLASAVAATEAKRTDRRLSDPDDMLAAIAGIINRANLKISDLVEEDASIDGMGTTFCGAMFNGEQFAVGHIGDSRGYLLHDGELTQFTHDHSWVQSLIDEGRLTPEQAATHPHRSLILKVLNGQEGFDPDLTLLDVAEGDRLLFCSDGLSGLVDDATIRDVLASHDVDDACVELARLANEHGGHDNITIVIGELVPQDDALDERSGELFGSAIEVEVPKIGALAAKSGKPSGYPSAPKPAPEAEATEQTPDESARYAPKDSGRGWIGLLSVCMAIALVIGVGAWGLERFVSSRYYIAPAAGTVAIYNGMPGSLLGMPLNTVAENTDVAVDDLPKFHRQAVNNTIAVQDLDAGRATAEQLRGLAERCRAVREQRLKPVDAAPSPSPSPTAVASIPGLPVPEGEEQANDVEAGFPTHLAPMTPTATAEADPESC